MNRERMDERQKKTQLAYNGTIVALWLACPVLDKATLYVRSACHSLLLYGRGIQLATEQSRMDEAHQLPTTKTNARHLGSTFVHELGLYLYIALVTGPFGNFPSDFSLLVDFIARERAI